jgi:uncharacterized membrane protein
LLEKNALAHLGIEIGVEQRIYETMVQLLLGAFETDDLVEPGVAALTTALLTTDQ